MQEIPSVGRLAALLLALLVPAAVFGAGRTAPAAATSAATSPSAAPLPDEKLSERILYEYLVAEIALQRGHTELAAQTYLDLAQRTRDPRIAKRAVEVASYARMPEVALDAAKIWHETEPRSPLALQMVTALLIDLHRVEQAEPYIADLFRLQPDSAAHGFMQLGRLLAVSPDKQANLTVVRRLAKGYPDLPEAHYALAQAALAANDGPLALGEAQRASALRPDWAMAAIFEAEILRRTSSTAAEARLADFLGKHPDSGAVRLAYARLLVGERHYAQARAQFERLLAAHPKDKDVIFAVGLLAAQLKDYATAQANLDKLITLGYHDIDGVRYALGQVAEGQKDWARAIHWYEQVGKGEHYLASRIRVAQVLAEEGELDQARAYLHAVETSDDNQRVQLVIAEAQLLRQAKRYHAAFAVLGKALAAQPDNPDLLYDYALAALKVDRFDLTESSLHKLIHLRPDSAQAYNALGYSLADRNERLPEARKLIEKALKLDPDDSYIIDSMGWVLYRMGELKAAAAQLHRAWLGRQDPEIGAHLGEVLWVMGQHEQARSVWQQALKNGPHNETLQRTMQRFESR